MAKKKPGKINPKKQAALITVKSRAYGEHTRAARGSIKPVTLNYAFITKGKQLSVINALASEVHSRLKQHAGKFKESMFWQKMLKRMHSAANTTTAALLTSLTGLDFNSRYPLQRFGTPAFITTKPLKNELSIALQNMHTLHFNNKVVAYRYELIVLFFDAKGKTTGEIVLNSKWFTIHEAAGVIMFDIILPKSSKFYLVCLRLHGGKDDEPLNELSSQGMQIVKVGSV